VSGIAWDKEWLTGIGGALGVVESFQPDAAFERGGVMAIQAARFKDRPDVAREIDGSVERCGAEQGDNEEAEEFPVGLHGKSVDVSARFLAASPRFFAKVAVENS
jgi:hypothetical protein